MLRQFVKICNELKKNHVTVDVMGRPTDIVHDCRYSWFLSSCNETVNIVCNVISLPHVQCCACYHVCHVCICHYNNIACTIVQLVQLNVGRTTYHDVSCPRGTTGNNTRSPGGLPTVTCGLGGPSVGVMQLMVPPKGRVYLSLL